jgi:uncharacterized protein YbjT (DUF2867 family)
MKIIITGSLGHISKPLAIELLQKKHLVTVVSSNAAKQKDIENLGANAAIGSLEDVDFLAATFAGADAVYCMIPPNNYFDKNLDLQAYYQKIATNYLKAIQQSGVKRVVYLSSIGAHLSKNSGILIGHHNGEALLNTLADVSITFMRPVGFYYNLLGFIPMIKSQGIIAANWGAAATLVWVSPIDIAAAVAEELETETVARKIRYVASDELSGHESASILGAAIGKPDLKWVIIPSEQMQSGLEAVGLNPIIAAGLVEMYASQQNGLLMEDYYLHRPASLGKIKLLDFAKDFAQVYNQ